jgi:Zn-dependent protease with chaperone function
MRKGYVFLLFLYCLVISSSTLWSPLIGLLSVAAIHIVVEISAHASYLKNSRRPSEQEEENIKKILQRLNEDTDIFIHRQDNVAEYLFGILNPDRIFIREDLLGNDDLEYYITHEVGHVKNKFYIYLSIFFPTFFFYISTIILPFSNYNIIINITLIPLVLLIQSYFDRKSELMAERFCWENGYTKGLENSIDADSSRGLFSTHPSAGREIEEYIDFKEEQEFE